jgi:hypothetical protein
VSFLRLQSDCRPETNATDAHKASNHAALEGPARRPRRDEDDALEMDLSWQFVGVSKRGSQEAAIRAAADQARKELEDAKACRIKASAWICHLGKQPTSVDYA